MLAGMSSAESPIADAERIEVSRFVPAPPPEVFAVLCDPQGHVDIDASGMLMDAEGEPVTAAGDRFLVHMDREALGDHPMGRYDVEVTITVFERDREIAWTIATGGRSPLGHVYGYRLEPADGGTRVTSYCDWSDFNAKLRQRVTFPVVPESALKGTLGILDRTVRRRQAHSA
jgi:uncharacterized protein YndB with AHSA1/START domain